MAALKTLSAALAMGIMCSTSAYAQTSEQADTAPEASQKKVISPMVRQYLGLWQFDRVMQQHKLITRAFDCSVTSKNRYIKSLGENRIEISGGDETLQYEIEQRNGTEYLAGRRTGEVVWEAPGEIFLLNAGYYWFAYRRCPE